MKIHVSSMLAIGGEMINKQPATMAYKIHKTQPQWLRKCTCLLFNCVSHVHVHTYVHTNTHIYKWCIYAHTCTHIIMYNTIYYNYVNIF